MKPIDLPLPFRKALRQLPKKRRQEIGRILQQVQLAYGCPHQHRGLGLRNLPKSYIEVRVGLGQRIMMRETHEALVCEWIGNHDDIRKFLKNI